MKDNPLRRLGDLGQSVWLDYLDRNMINSGELERLINEDGVRGVTSNPAIFAKAFSGSTAYDEEIDKLARQGRTVPEIYEQLTLADVRNAADLFRSGFKASDGRHGFVSLEVNPHLARDTEGTIEEARRLWRELDHPNVLIKVPATIEGLPAIQQLISEGINVNVTLLFGLDRYRQVAEAYIAGLERMMEEGRSPSTASVASFFLSRIDVLVDERLEAIAAEGGERGAKAAALRGESAVASAKQAYRMYREIYAAERFRKLAVQRARPQRLLWASTSTKNPAYSDVKYVEPLIGPETINTMPRKTMDAYRDHGQPAARLEEGVDGAVRKHRHLAELGIDLDQVTAQLEEEGIEKFNRPYDGSMEDLGRKTTALTETSRTH
jgi:transaldolase